MCDLLQLRKEIIYINTRDRKQDFLQARWEPYPELYPQYKSFKVSFSW